MNINALRLSLFLLLFVHFGAILAQPPNDDLVNATAVNTIPYTNTIIGSLLDGATNEDTEEGCQNTGSWWYRFQPEQTASYTITAQALNATGATPVDLEIGIFTGADFPLNRVVCQDLDNGIAGGEVLNQNLSLNEIYYFRIANAEGGNIDDVTFTLDFTTYNWVGTIDDDWAVADNWSTGIVPNTNSLVTISDVSNNVPKVKPGTNAFAKSVTLSKNGQLTINNGGDLAIQGTEEKGIILSSSETALQVDGILGISNHNTLGIDLQAGSLRISNTGFIFINTLGHGIETLSTQPIIVNGGLSITNLRGKDGVRFMSSESAMRVASTGGLTITGNNMANEDGIYFGADGGSLTVDGKMDLISLSEHGIFQEFASTVNINSSASVMINNIGFVGVGINVAGATFNVSGQLTIKNGISNSAIDQTTGSLNINNGAILNIEQINGTALQNIVGTNNGTINITNVETGIRTGSGTFENATAGSITISGALGDGVIINAGQVLNNKGVTSIDGCGDLCISDALSGIFHNQSTGTLKANGIVSAANTILEPGCTLSPSSCITFNGGEDFSGININININGNVNCSQFDNISVLGPLDMNGANLNLSGNYIPQLSDNPFDFMGKNGNDAITGKFTGLDERAIIVFNGAEFEITYQGGNGNDIALRVVNTLPNNDDLTNAIVVPSLPYNNMIPSIELKGATGEASEEACVYTNSWWYAFTPTITRAYLVAAEALAGNTSEQTELSLGVYTGTVHPLTEVTCINNNSGNLGGEKATVNLTAGVTYYFRVAAQNVLAVDKVTFAIDFSTYDWLGTQSDDWDVGQNWQGGVVPNANAQVIIQDVSLNTPKIKAGVNAVAKSLTLQNTGSLEVAQNGALRIANIRGQDGVTVASSGSLQIDGTVSIENIENSNGISVQSGNLTVGTTGQLTINDVVRGIDISSTEGVVINGSVKVTEFSFGTGINLSGAGANLSIASTGKVTLEGSLGFQLGIIFNAVNTALTVDGTLEVKNIGFWGIHQKMASTVDINPGAKVTLSQVARPSGNNYVVFLEDAAAVMNVAGELTIENSGFRSAIYELGGTFQVKAGGVANFNGIIGTAIDEWSGINDGTVNVEGATNGIITTAAFTNSTTGVISISAISNNGINVNTDQIFNNRGTILIGNTTNFAISADQNGVFKNQSTGTLNVDGQVSASNITFESSSTLNPGTSPGCVTFDGTEDFSNTTINIEIDGRTACTQYDQVVVNGDVTLTGAILNITGSYAALPFQSFIILDNQGTNPINGTFLGLNEGSTFVANSQSFQISYVGGDGNDIVLNAVSYEWTGAVSDDWNTAGNWSTNSVPAENSSVSIIDISTNTPNIKSGVAAVADNVTISNTGALNINENGSLTLISGQSIIVNHGSTGLLKVDGTLDIKSTALFVATPLTIANGRFEVGQTGLVKINSQDGMVVNSTDTVLIDGMLEIVNLSIQRGIDLKENASMIVSSTGKLSIQGTKSGAGGISMEDRSRLTINGEVELKQLGGSGIVGRPDADVGIAVNAGGKLIMDEVGREGIVLGNGKSRLSVSGELMLRNGFSVAAIDLNDGDINVNSGGLVTIDQVGNYAIYDLNGINHGTINISNTGATAVLLQRQFENSTTGIFTISGTPSNGIDLSSFDEFANKGSINISNASNLAIAGAGTFKNQSTGTLTVEGTVSAATTELESGSALNPGSSPGQLTFNASEDFSNTNINIEVDGTTPITQHDVIAITGDLTLGGNLNVTFNYNSIVGDRIVFMTYTGSRVGEFATYNSGQDPNNMYYLDYSVAGEVAIVITAAINLNFKVFLQGPYDTSTGLMKTNLKDLADFPTTLNGFTIADEVLAQTGNQAVVDWVTIELRDASNRNLVEFSRPALLLANGTIVDMDGTSMVSVPDLTSLTNYIAIKHRNHLGVLTLSTIQMN